MVCAIVSVAYGAEVYAFSDTTTHPALTEQTVEFYNKMYPNTPLSNDEREWLIEGSTKEDIAPRWINHFYDPTTGLGWTGDSAGRLPAELVRIFSEIMLSSEHPVSALAWAHNESLQEAYRLYGGNHTWEQALRSRSKQNIKDAYVSLGHMLHLLQDLGVPDHSRNDTHAHLAEFLTGDPGSPHETYAAQWNRETIRQLDFPASMQAEGIKPFVFGSIDEYLRDMAVYSNKYFFSGDTVLSTKYTSPTIIRIEDGLAYGRDEHGVEMPIASVEYPFGSSATSGMRFALLERTGYHPIFDAYFERIAPRIIASGAGVIDLFKKEYEKGNDGGPGWFISSWSQEDITSRIGAIAMIGRLAGDAVSAVKNTISGWFGAGATPQTEVVLTDDKKIAVEIDESGTEAQTPTKPTQSTSKTPASPAKPVATQTTKTPTAQAPARSASTKNPSKTSGAKSASAKPAATQQTVNAPSAPTKQIAAPTKTPASWPSYPANTGAVTPTSTQQTTPTSTANTIPTSSAPIAPVQLFSSPRDVVISEIQIAGATDPADEFIELYNPTSLPIDLSSSSIQYISGAAESFNQIKKKNFEPGMQIPARGYFLIARGLDASGDDGYRGTIAPDLSMRTFSMSGADTGGAVFIVEGHTAITSVSDAHSIDHVAYGTAQQYAETAPTPLPQTGSSIERAASNAGTCVHAIGAGEFMGNACDSDNNHDDFAVRPVPRPQNTQSLTEPRSPDALDAIPVTATYASSSMEIQLAWQRPQFASAGQVTYSISENGSVIKETTSTTTAFRISEIGRTYDLVITARDSAGATTSANASVTAPSFLSSAALYIDPNHDAENYAVSFTYSAVPFIPPLFSIPTMETATWQAMVLYLNQKPDMTASVLSTAHALEPITTSTVVQLKVGDAEKRALVFAMSEQFTGTSGGGLLQNSFVLPREDGRLTVLLASSTSDMQLNVHDYITIAYYDYSRTGGGTQDLTLIAADATKYYFQQTLPSNAAPTNIGNISTSFDVAQRLLQIGWSSSTDPDGIDALLQYEFAYYRIGAGDFVWNNTGNAASTVVSITEAGEYRIGVRVIDGLHAVSPTSEITWTTPEDFTSPQTDPPTDQENDEEEPIALPEQLDHTLVIGFADGQTMQGITVPFNAELDAIALWAGNSGAYCCAESYLTVYKNNNGAPGELIGTSSPVRLERNIHEQENVYVFPELAMTKDEPYWLVPVQSALNLTSFYGSATDTYSGGIWTANGDRDAYFRLIEKPPVIAPQ